ncbi:MAG: hypothetical protein K0R94_1427, partial [Burkholderiales bacterium]|nr:hypothetical protein [Burkholderiales bacterium]
DYNYVLVNQSSFENVFKIPSDVPMYLPPDLRFNFLVINS